MLKRIEDITLILQSVWGRVLLFTQIEVKHRNYLVCEKFPSAAARQYVHNGKEAFMVSDGVGRPGFIVLQDDAEEVDDDMRLGYLMPETFTLVHLKTERDLSGIKNLYLL